MSRVQIRQCHHKSDTEVRGIIEDVERQLISQFGLSTRWKNDSTVCFTRPGLKGELVMESGCVVINMKLGIMFGLHSRQIQTALNDALEEKLA